MRKVNYPKVIKESLSTLENRLKDLSTPKLRDRCEVLIWLKSGKVSTMKEAMVLKGYTKTQGQNWWKQYKSEGLDSFLQTKYRGQTSPLEDKDELRKRLSEEGFATINEAREWILQTYGIHYTENGLGNYFRHHKIRLKTGRPTHPKKDDGKRAEYKKNTKRS